MRAVLVVLAVLALSSCARTYWAHQFKTEQQFYEDNAQCLAMAGSGTQSSQIQPVPDSRTNPFGAGMARGWNQAQAAAAAADRNTIHEHCLRGRGWHTIVR